MFPNASNRRVPLLICIDRSLTSRFVSEKSMQPFSIPLRSSHVGILERSLQIPLGKPRVRAFQRLGGAVSGVEPGMLAFYRPDDLCSHRKSAAAKMRLETGFGLERVLFSDVLFGSVPYNPWERNVGSIRSLINNTHDLWTSRKNLGGDRVLSELTMLLNQAITFIHWDGGEKKPWIMSEICTFVQL